MPKIDYVGEVIIDNPPMAVYKALLNEVAGVTQWWMPSMAFKLRGDTPIDHEGAIYDATINPTSRMKAKFSAKLTKIVEAKLMEEDIAGDFVGTASWTFEPTDGKTKTTHRFNARTNNPLMSLFSPFVNFEKRHSDTMQKGFKALNSYLSKK
jgi:uncharacterized protein YndB with AHSA1/START domain